MAEKINVILMLEILGKPADYVKKTLSDIVEKLGKEKNVKLISKRIAEPKPLKEQEVGQELFTTFAEVELQTTLQQLMLLVFGYMPSHIDIIEPENLEIKNSDLNLFFNELTRKLHQYDELARALMIERQILAKQIQEGKIKVTEAGEKKEKGKKKKKKSRQGKKR